MNIILFDIIGLLLIALVVWWFWLGKSAKTVQVEEGGIDILVDKGVYSPDAISAKAGQPITLRFLRKDETPCSATVVFADFEQSAELPIDKTVEITVTPEHSGEFEFTCQMGMYRGKLIVTN